MVCLGGLASSAMLGGLRDRDGDEQPRLLNRESSEGTLLADSGPDKNPNETRAILLVNIPPHLQSLEALKDFLASLSGPGAEIRCLEFVHDTSELEETVANWMKVVDEIEATMVKVETQGGDVADCKAWFEGQQVSTVDKFGRNLSRHLSNTLKADEGLPSPLPALPEHLQDELIDQTRRFRTLDQQILALRSRAGEQPPGPTAFALLSSKTFPRTIPPTLPTFFDSVKLLFKPRFRIQAAPSPRDVAWGRLGKQHSWPIYVLRTIGVWTFIVALSVFWTIPVGFIIGVLNLENLADLFPWLAPAIEAMGPAVKGLIQGLIPALIVSIWQAVLPLIFTGELSIDRGRGDQSGIVADKLLIPSPS
jgi:hypothetical protein